MNLAWLLRGSNSALTDADQSHTVQSANFPHADKWFSDLFISHRLAASAHVKARGAVAVAKITRSASYSACSCGGVVQPDGIGAHVGHPGGTQCSKLI